jgi:hypothetical protein
MRFLITSLVLTFALTGLIGCAAEDEGTPDETPPAEGTE